MLTLNGVSKSYQPHSRVLEQVNLELKQGDFIYVLGGTGAGKSSLLRMIATEESPTQGEISIFGYRLSKLSESSLCKIRRVIGYIPQNLRLIPDLTVYENITLSLATAGGMKKDSKKLIYHLLDRFGLMSKRDVRAQALSGGEAQRVAVARALVREPELIIADEPTGAQDRDFTWSLMELFVKANMSGCTVLVATHDAEIVRRVRKRCAILRGGKLSLEEGFWS